MQPINKFLQAVESKLRGPAVRRPEVIEELRGHLADRTEALVQQEYEPEEAETQAIKEMGSAWLLAARLSFAHGWNIIPEILRELGALGLSLVMILLAVPQLYFISRIADPNIPGPTNPWAAAAVAVVSGYLISLAALALFAFYLARLRQSRIWAMIPAFVFFNQQPFSWSYNGAIYFAGLGFVIAVIWGARRPSPRPVWPLLAAAGTALLTGFGVILKVVMAATHLPLSLKMAADYFPGTLDTAQFWGLLGASGILWLGAWILERVKSSSVVKA